MDNNKEYHEMEDWAKSGLEAYSKNADLSQLEQRLQKKMDARLATEKDNKKTEGPKILKLLLPIAAIAAVALLLLWPSSNNMQSIFDNQYEMMPQLFDVTERGTETFNKEGLDNAIQAYHNGEYSECISRLNKLETPNELKTLYLGLSHLAQKNGQESITQFSKISDKNFSDVKDWYLALAYIQIEDQMNAAKILKNIVNQSSHYKKTEAQNILKLWK